jgi:hypothetical protein
MENSNPPLLGFKESHQDKSSSLNRLRRHYHSQSKIAFLKIALVASLLFGFVTVLILGVVIHVLSNRNESVLVDARRTERALHEAEAELEGLRSQIASLVKNRIPKLKHLRYDAVIDIGDKYIKNIVFTEIRQGTEKRYEYKMVMQNGSISPTAVPGKPFAYDGS